MVLSSVNANGGVLGRPASSRFFCMNVEMGATQLVEIKVSAEGLACGGSSPSIGRLRGRLSFGQSLLSISGSGLGWLASFMPKRSAISLSMKCAAGMRSTMDSSVLSSFGLMLRKVTTAPFMWK